MHNVCAVCTLSQSYIRGKKSNTLYATKINTITNYEVSEKIDLPSFLFVKISSSAHLPQINPIINSTKSTINAKQIWHYEGLVLIRVKIRPKKMFPPPNSTVLTDVMRIFDHTKNILDWLTSHQESCSLTVRLVPGNY